MGIINRFITFLWSNDVNSSKDDYSSDVENRLSACEKTLQRIERMAYRKREKGLEPYIPDDNHGDEDITVNDIMGAK